MSVSVCVCVCMLSWVLQASLSHHSPLLSFSSSRDWVFFFIQPGRIYIYMFLYLFSATREDGFLFREEDKEREVSNPSS